MVRNAILYTLAKYEFTAGMNLLLCKGAWDILVATSSLYAWGSKVLHV